LLDKNGNSIAYLNHTFTQQHTAEQYIDQITQQIQKLEQESQCVTIIEHIFLKPLGEMSCFGFSIHDEDGVQVFSSDAKYTFSERASVIEQVMESGVSPANYAIIPAGVGCSKISIYDNQKNQLVSTTRFYSNQEDLEKEILRLSDNFTAFKKNADHLAAPVSYFTKHCNLFGNTNDPFSFIVSVIIPSWPGRFQDPRFRAHIERTIQRDFPAHIFANVIWMDMTGMKSFQEMYNEFLHEKRRKTPDVSKLAVLSDQLLLLIA
jgi:hypothetical protein